MTTSDEAHPSRKGWKSAQHRFGALLPYNSGMAVRLFVNRRLHAAGRLDKLLSAAAEGISRKQIRDVRWDGALIDIRHVRQVIVACAAADDL